MKPHKKNTQKKPLLCYRCKGIMSDKPVEHQKWKEGYAICDGCHDNMETEKTHKKIVLKKSILYTLAFVFGIIIAGWAILGNVLLIYLMEVQKVQLILFLPPSSTWRMTTILPLLNFALTFSMALVLIKSYKERMRELK